MALSRAILLLTFSVALASQARADFNNRSPYSFPGLMHLGLTAGFFIAGSIPNWATDDLTRVPCGTCDTSSVPEFDRAVTGFRSSSAEALSDVFLSLSLTLPTGVAMIDLLSDIDSDGIGGWAKDLLVSMEALGLTYFVSQVAKHSFKRARPLTYNPDVPTEQKLKRDATLSFFSNHTASAFSLAVAFSRTYQARHSNSWSTPWVWFGTLSIALGTGVSRVYSGKVFWSDMLTGAAMGSLIALGITELHWMSENPFAILPMPDGLQLTYRF